MSPVVSKVNASLEEPISLPMPVSHVALSSLSLCVGHKIRKPPKDEGGCRSQKPPVPRGGCFRVTCSWAGAAHPHGPPGLCGEGGRAEAHGAAAVSPG